MYNSFGESDIIWKVGNFIKWIVCVGVFVGRYKVNLSDLYLRLFEAVTNQ